MLIVYKKGKHGFINLLGEIIIPCIWENAFSFKDGTTIVKDNQGDAFILNAKGEVLVKNVVSHAYHTNNKGKKEIIIYENKLWGFYDKNGRKISEPQWEYVAPFNEGLAPVKRNGYWGAIDSNGDLIVDCKWQQLMTPNEGFFVVKNDNKFGFIDKSGEIKIQIEWENADSFSEGMAAVKKGGKWGCIDKNGKLVIECVWDSIGMFKYGVSVVEIKYKKGIINNKGELIAECVWDKLELLDIGLAVVEEECSYSYNKKGLLNINTGKIVLEPFWHNIEILNNKFAELTVFCDGDEDRGSVYGMALFELGKLNYAVPFGKYLIFILPNELIKIIPRNDYENRYYCSFYNDKWVAYKES